MGVVTTPKLTTAERLDQLEQDLAELTAAVTEIAIALVGGVAGGSVWQRSPRLRALAYKEREAA